MYITQPYVRDVSKLQILVSLHHHTCVYGSELTVTVTPFRMHTLRSEAMLTNRGTQAYK